VPPERGDFVMRDAALALLTSRAILERQAQQLAPETSCARHAEAALAHLTLCIAFTRATSLRGTRAKARFLAAHLLHGTHERALAISLARDLDVMARRLAAGAELSKLT
jgi:hypothetical protein